jgi:hypothetical protein
MANRNSYPRRGIEGNPEEIRCVKLPRGLVEGRLTVKRNSQQVGGENDPACHNLRGKSNQAEEARYEEAVPGF